MPDHRASENRVGAYWDALVLGQNPASIDLDPGLAEAIQRFQALGVAPAATARERVWQNVQTAIGHQNESEDPMQPSLVLGGSRPFAQPISPDSRSRPWRGRTRWAVTQLATAALLVLTIAAGLVTIGQWRPGSSPPAGNHQLAAVPAAASPEALPVAASPEAQPALAEFVGEISLDPDGTDDRSSAASGLAVAADGTLYVIDSRQDHIRVFDRAGNAIATWGESGEGPGQFQFGEGFFYGDLAVGPDGNLYVLDTANRRVQVLSPDGTYLREWGEVGTEEGQFSVPSGIGVDDAGRVYVTETGNRRLQIFDSDGQFLVAWEPSEADGGPFMDPADVAIDAAGIVSVTDFDKHQIFRFDAEGTVIDRLGRARQYTVREAEQPGYMNALWGAAVDTRGNLYVAESLGHRTLVFAPDGAPLGVIEGVSTTPRQDSMSPIYLAIGADGMLYVSDESTPRIQVFRLLSPLVAAPATPVSG